MRLEFFFLLIKKKLKISKMRMNFVDSLPMFNVFFIDTENINHFPEDFEDLPKRNESARLRRRDRITASPRVGENHTIIQFSKILWDTFSISYILIFTVLGVIFSLAYICWEFSKWSQLGVRVGWAVKFIHLD